MKQEPRALLFDMDGLLLDTETVHMRAYAELTAQMGKPQTAETFKQFIGESHLVTAQWLIDALSLPGPRAALIARQQAIYLRMVTSERPAPMPGVGELFELCDRRSFKRALVTSSEEVQVGPTMQVVIDHLKRPGVWKEYFEVIATGERVKRRKPDPDLYLLAVEELKLPARACIALEDSPAGVVAAHAAGCRVIAVPNIYLKAKDVAQGKAEFVFPSLLDVYKNFDHIAQC